jgi:hypothetical protein
MTATNNYSNLTGIYQALIAELISSLSDAVDIAGDDDNNYGLNLIDISDWDVELLADGYRVTHLNSTKAIANGHHYSLSVITESDQLESLCGVVDLLTTFAVLAH